jgi:chromosomal replication initiation ATPase DnaA
MSVAKHSSEQKLTIEQVAKYFTEIRRVRLDMICGRRKELNIAHLRHEFIWLLFQVTSASPSEIASFLDNRKLSTIMSAVGKVEEQRRTNIKTKLRLDGDIVNLKSQL